MRIWGRVYAEDGSYTWQKVETTADGNDDYVRITSLIQVLKLIRGESPFWANYGIPAQQAVVQQVFPDFYVALTQTQFAGYFASLIVTKRGGATPTYDVNLVTNQGTPLALEIPV